MSDKENKPELDSNAEKTPNSSTELLEYLTREIETTTTNMMVFRSKIAFAVFVGPFLLLIALAAGTRSLNVTTHIDLPATLFIIVVCLCFLTMAYITARIERQAWLQCNKWRRLIIKLHNDPSTKLASGDLSDDLFDERRAGRATSKYVAAWAVLLLSFIMTIAIILRIFVPQPTARATTSEPAQKGSVSPEN